MTAGHWARILFNEFLSGFVDDASLVVVSDWLSVVLGVCQRILVGVSPHGRGFTQVFDPLSSWTTVAALRPSPPDTQRVGGRCAPLRPRRLDIGRTAVIGGTGFAIWNADGLAVNDLDTSGGNGFFT
jgi:hypothetical protein